MRSKLSAVVLWSIALPLLGQGLHPAFLGGGGGGSVCLRGAYSFDGTDDRIIFGDVLEDVITGSNAKFSISAWVRPDSLASTGIILGKSATSAVSDAQRQFFFYIHSSEKLGFTYYGALDATSYRVWYSDVSISTGVWSHVSVSYDGSEPAGSRVELYLNGVKLAKTLAATSGTPSTIPNGTAPLVIGAEVNTAETLWSALFDGLISSVKMWDDVVSETEFLDLYSLGVQPPHSLVLDIQMDGNADDSSSNGNDGTVTGAVNTTDLPPCFPWLKDCPAGALYFNGGQNAVIPDDDTLDFGTGDFSLSYWYKYDMSSMTTGDEKGLLGKYTVTTGPGLLFEVSSWGHTAPFTSVGAVFRINYKTIDLSSQDFYTDGEWTHVVVTRQGTTMEVYRNGSRYATTTQAGIGTSVDNSASLQLAQNIWQGRMKGHLSGLKFWNRTLTATDVSFLAQNYEVSDGLVLSWPMDGDLVDSVQGLTGTYSATLTTDIVDLPLCEVVEVADIYSHPFLSHYTSRVIRYEDDPVFDTAGGDMGYSFWIYQQNTLGVSKQFEFCGKSGDGEGNSLQVVYHGSSSGGTLRAFHHSTVPASSSITLNTWTHYTVVKDVSAQKIIIYKNGVFSAESIAHPVNTNNDDNASPFYIGGAGNGAVYRWYGKQAEFMYHSYAPDADEALFIYKTGLPPRPDETILLSRWIGGSLEDTSGNNLTGSKGFLDSVFTADVTPPTHATSPLPPATGAR